MSIAANDANIIYSPANWDVTSGRALAVNPGAYFRMGIVNGPSSIDLTFDTAGMDSGTSTPQISYRIDGQGWTTVPVTSTVSVPLPATNTWTTHLLEMVVKSINSVARWTSPTSFVKFTGVTTAPTTCTTIAIPRRPRSLWVYGDSITEGIKTLKASGTNGADAHDSTLSWAFMLGDLLGVEVGVIGFNGQGILDTGSGNTPAMATTYDKIVSGISRSFTVAPNGIAIAMGQNDGTVDIKAAYGVIVEALLAAMPTTKLALLRPLSGIQAANVQAVAAAASKPARVAYIDTTGFVNVADASASSDNLHPYGAANLTSIAPKIAAELRKQLIGGAASIKRSDGTWKTISPVTVLG